MPKEEPPLLTRWVAYTLVFWPSLPFWIVGLSLDGWGRLLVFVPCVILPLTGRYLTQRLQTWFNRYPDLRLLDALRMKEEDLDPYR